MSKSSRRWTFVLFLFGALIALLWLTAPYWPPTAEETKIAMRIATFGGRRDVVPGIAPVHVRITGFMDKDYWFEYRMPPGTVPLYEAQLKKLFASGNKWHTNDAILNSATDLVSHGDAPPWFPRGRPPSVEVLYFEELDDGPGRPRQTPNGRAYTRVCRWYYFSPKDDRVFLYTW